MAAPVGKGLVIRDSRFYPSDDPVGYAARLGCTFVILLEKDTTDAMVRQAQDMGLGALFWQGPHDWEPGTWQRTLYTQAERADRLGMQGFIADAEHGWQNQRAEAEAMRDDLRSAVNLLPSVGFTSYTSWRYRDTIAESGVFGAPQVYGKVDPATPAQLRARADKWLPTFAEVTPIMALHSPEWHPPERYWRNTLEEQMEYQSYFEDFRAIMLWQHIGTDGKIYPAVGTDEFQLWQEWMPEGAALPSDWIWQPDLDQPPTARSLVSTTLISALRRARGRLV